MMVKKVGRQNVGQKEHWADRIINKTTVGRQSDKQKEQWADRMKVKKNSGQTE